ncbi:hypothetical protein A2U01_0100869, partial [Trifolium medium]|nr:hypothetical protein [Trifolium medium]
VGLSILLRRQNISPETVPPGRRLTVPLSAVITGAKEARDELGQPPSVTKVDELYPTSPIP